MENEILKSTLQTIMNFSDDEIRDVSVTVKKGNALNKGTISLTVDYHKIVELKGENK